MLRYFAPVSALVLSLTLPALADDVTRCDESSIAMVTTAIAGATDPDHPDRAQMGNMELDAAKLSMKEGKIDDCVKHLNMAMQALNAN